MGAKKTVEPLKSDATIKDLLDIIHQTIIKKDGKDEVILKELKAIDKKIDSGELTNHAIETPMWWTCVFNDVKKNGYTLKEK